MGVAKAEGEPRIVIGRGGDERDAVLVPPDGDGGVEAGNGEFPARDRQPFAKRSPEGETLGPLPAGAAPRTPFNAAITAHRRFAFRSTSLELVKDMLYQAYVRKGKLQQAMMVRRFFAEETLDKITPINRVSGAD